MEDSLQDVNEFLYCVSEELHLVEMLRLTGHPTVSQMVVCAHLEIYLTFFRTLMGVCSKDMNLVY